MLEIFANVVLPVLMVAGFGYALQRSMQPQLQALSQVSIYVLQPSLTFTSLLHTNLRSEEPLKIMLFSALLTASMMVVAVAVAKAARMDRSMGSAFMLATIFPNVGNYGLSVVMLAYGQAGLDKAIMLFVLQSIFSGTLAVAVASSSNASIGTALKQVFKLPQIYAVLLALVCNLAQIQVPAFLATSTDLASKAAIPLMLVMLGMQMARTTTIEEPKTVGAAVVVRLVVGVFVAFGITLALGLEGDTRDVVLIQSAMPTAVFTTLMATEFNARPRFVTSVVLATTVLSLITVTALLAVLPGTSHLS